MKQEFKGSTIVSEDKVARLHKFSDNPDATVFVIPPHAGRHGNVTQNLIDSLVAEGKGVYALELLPATKETGGTSVLDLVIYILDYRSQINTPKVDMIGICQGGWLSAIFAALFPNAVNRLALFASPINTRTGEDNSIEKYCSNINLDWHKSIVDMSGGIQPGFMQWWAFALSNPTAVFYSRYADQFFNILKNNDKAIEKWRKNQSWYDSPQDLHGTWFLEVLEHHFTNNELYEGTWDLGHGVIPKLKDITCPIYVYSGANDKITHPKQAEGILNKVSSAKKYYRCFEGAGHTAIFAKHSCIDSFIGDFYYDTATRYDPVVEEPESQEDIMIRTVLANAGL